MHMHNSEHHSANDYSIKTFLPLIVILSVIISFTIVRRMIYGWELRSAMNDFMGSFFIVFSLFKIYNLNGFAEAYSTYDLIAKRSMIYAYAYPFIELSLGIAYLLGVYPTATNILTLILMTIGSIGVALELAQGHQITCACLGAVFKIPMTYVTLLEDLSMAFMALLMLILYFR